MSIKVLYIEDEVFLGKIVKECLEIRGFEVFMESNGANVLRLFEEAKPDICILDVMLPNRNGFELAEDIRQLNQDMPIIFLTAKTQTEDVVRGFKLGGNDYIRKPFSMEELIVRIENVLRLIQSSEIIINADVLSIGQFKFHHKRQILTIGIQEKKLSYRESVLLKYLWLHRNNVIDRRELLNHIWGNDSFFNSRNLDVYITKMRGYLKNDVGVEILTIKGVGYRFIIS